MRKFLCYDTNDAASGKINVDNRGMLKPGVQSDWNQNDETAADYVKNRPFYTGDPVETVLVEESTVMFEGMDGLYGASFPSTFEATVGETYKVSWDGATYECTCVDLVETPVFGNLSVVGAGSDTGEPFIMGASNGEEIQILTADSSSSHTFSISRTVAPVVKIDKKYLVQPDWNQNDETAADFVKNRPFYMGDLVLVEESTVPFTEDNGLYGTNFPSTFEATVGETYTVTWDDTVYECICVSDSVGPVIGNLSIVGDGSDSGEPFFMGIMNGERIQILTADTSASHTISISATVAPVVKIDEKYLPDTLLSFKPAGKSYLTFSSPNSFTLAVADSTKHWNGNLEYFASNKTWTIWDGTSALSAVADDGEYFLYLRGAGNTVITGAGLNHKWILTGTDIKCIGNIENLLDYATVESGAHPIMANYCYSSMFASCTALTQAPTLPATTLANYCYYYMFSGCTSLAQAPALPATTLAEGCYKNMFQGCTSLAQAPALPATTLAEDCYYYMFSGCTSLTHAPALPATTLAEHCYSGMFEGCTALTQVPALPATTLAIYCYQNMFSGCTNLTQAPALPATTLAENCYYYMFSGCTALTQAPALPATTLTSNCYSSMFASCTALTQAPALPATTLAEGCYRYMFYCCTSLKLSSRKTGEYTVAYRIPTAGTGTTATNALSSMFTGTGGTFTGAPEINTTYYLSSDNIIVRETEISTLNGYVGAMIDAHSVILPSSTEGSTKKFKITVDDTGTISATEVTT